MEENQKDIKKTGRIEIFLRGIVHFKNKFIMGPRVHPIIKDWNGKYHELKKDLSGKITILDGKVTEISKASRNYLKKMPKPDYDLLVYKSKFKDAIKNFTEKYDGKQYKLLDFKKNCIGFKDYLIKKAKLRD